MVDPGRGSTQTMRFRQLQVPTVGLLRALIEPHYRRVGDGLRLHLCHNCHTALLCPPKRRVILTRRTRRGLGEGGLVNWQCRGYPVPGCVLWD